VVNVAAVIATAVNTQGNREIIGFDIATNEDTSVRIPRRRLIRRQ
jgi:transposase-like protein